MTTPQPQAPALLDILERKVNGLIGAQRKKIAELQRDLDQSRGEAASVQSKLQAAQLAVSALQSDLVKSQAATKRCTDAQGTATTTDTAVTDLKARLQLAEASKSSVISELAALKTSTDNLGAQLQLRAADAASKGNALAALKQEFDKLKQDCDAQRVDFGKRNATLSASFKQLDEEMTGKVQTITRAVEDATETLAGSPPAAAPRPTVASPPTPAAPTPARGGGRPTVRRGQGLRTGGGHSSTPAFRLNVRLRAHAPTTAVR